jgi:DNA polymerase-1
MYSQLINGEDLHTSMALAITNKKLHPDGVIKSFGTNDEYITSEDRTNAKGVNFGYVFGMSAATYQNYAFISYGVKVTIEEATKLREAYFKQYPGFRKYHNNVWNNFNKPSFFYETALGRKVKPRLGTDGINGPVQGSGAETTKLAVHYLIKEYPDAIKYLYNVVHDAAYLRVPRCDKALWLDRLQKAMVKGWTEISKSKLFHFKDIPMPVGE